MAINIIKVVTIEISISEKPRCNAKLCPRDLDGSKEHRLKLPINWPADIERSLVIAETPKRNRNQQEKYNFDNRD
jgi:hypothetical protein